MNKMARAAVCAIIAVTFVAGTAGCKKSSGTVNDEFSPVSSLVMTEEEAASLGDKMAMTIYHVTKDDKSLVGETHLVSYGAKDKKLQNIVSSIVDQVISGPPSGSVLKTAMPTGTKQKGTVKIVSNMAIVDLNQQFVDGLSKEKKIAELTVYALINSVTELKEIESVKITVEGKEVPTTSSGVKLNLAYKRNLTLIKDKATIIEPIDETQNDDYADVDLE